MRRIAYVVLTLLVAVPASAGAQTSSTPLRDAVRKEAARLARSDRTSMSTTVRDVQSSVSTERSWPARHPIVLGTLVGTGIGLGVLATHDCRRSSDYTCSALAAFFGGTGAGLGALGGAVASIFLP
jgi:hypothetical protein